eukprot:GHVQ01009250.1.p1 GENE.GHVQ01009250.1~~GHVQ01009250.1.p1  ORF type:complete len:155 (+),score=10.93 GHVQ01009250.1:242-706(+)
MSVRTQPMKSQRGKCRSPLVYLSIGLMGSLLLVGVFCCSTALVAASVDEPPTHRYGLGFTKSSIDEESLVVKQRVLAVEQTTDVGAWANVKCSKTINVPEVVRGYVSKVRHAISAVSAKLWAHRVDIAMDLVLLVISDLFFQLLIAIYKAITGR